MRRGHTIKAPASTAAGNAAGSTEETQTCKYVKPKIKLKIFTLIVLEIAFMFLVLIHILNKLIRATKIR